MVGMRHLPCAAVILDPSGDYAFRPFRQRLDKVIGARMKKHEGDEPGLVRADDFIRRAFDRRRMVLVDGDFHRVDRADFRVSDGRPAAAVDQPVRAREQNIDDARPRRLLHKRGEARADAFQRGDVGEQRIENSRTHRP